MRKNGSPDAIIFQINTGIGELSADVTIATMALIDCQAIYDSSLPIDADLHILVQHAGITKQTRPNIINHLLSGGKLTNIVDGKIIRIMQAFQYRRSPATQALLQACSRAVTSATSFGFSFALVAVDNSSKSATYIINQRLKEVIFISDVLFCKSFIIFKLRLECYRFKPQVTVTAQYLKYSLCAIFSPPLSLTAPDFNL